MLDVAALAGVGLKTVSRVVNDSGRVRPATRRRVERAMRDLAYIPNRAARSLVVNKLGVLALVIPDISNPFFPRLARGAEAAAREADYTVILGNTDENYEDELVKILKSFDPIGACRAIDDRMEQLIVTMKMEQEGKT